MDEFNRLADQWDAETGHHSNPAIIRRHPNYAKLVAYGKEAVPWVLARIRAGNYRLENSQLLCVLTGERPDYQPEIIEGTAFAAWNVREFADAWLAWGERHGY